MNSGKRLAIILTLFLQYFTVSFLLAQKPAQPKQSSEVRIPLHEGWTLQTSAKVEAK